ncbi:MAG TPA: DUF4118 domain-containing protein [Syntrophorhabdales bacterium]|nr:DUF4118 domain-containing protein [Syntrophorhabdales bacterium]
MMPKTGRSKKSEGTQKPLSSPGLLLRIYLKVFLCLFMVTLIGGALSLHNIDLVNIAILYLLPVLVSAVFWGRGPSFLAAIVGVLAFHYFFVPPPFSFRLANPRDFFILAVFLIVAFVTGTMAARLRTELEKTKQREKRTLALYALSRNMAAESDLRPILEAFAENVAATVTGEVVVLVRGPDTDILYKAASYPPESPPCHDEELTVAQRVLEHGRREEIRTGNPREVFLPINTDERTLGVFAIKPASHEATFSSEQTQLIEAFANLAAVAIARVKQVEAADNRLRRSNDQLRALSARFQSISEEARTILAREIHDELGQVLTGLKMDLLRLSKKPPEQQRVLADQIKSMGHLVDDTIQVVRKVCTRLRPSVLDDLGLLAAIEWQVEDFEKRTQIECELSSRFDDSHVDRNLSTAIFRILQEALTNVFRHARATQVKISVEEDASAIVMTVEDNGKGITEREVSDPKSLGLLGMHERALLYGGEVQINGEDGKGTRVMVRIPARQAEVHLAQDSRS